MFLALAIPLDARADPSPPTLERAARAHLKEVAAAKRVPGLAAGVRVGDRQVFEFLDGIDGDNEPVGRGTPFLIGSIAKSMTAALVLQLRDAGRLGLSDRVGDHLPWLNADDTTIEELLTHTSGYTGGDGLAVSERYDNAPGAVRRAAQQLQRSGARGHYAYSSANYLLLGAMIEQLDGRPFGEVLRTKLLLPLDMTHTTALGSADQSAGYRQWWGYPRRYAPGFDASGGPYGYVSSTLADMERYASAQAGAEPAVLSPRLLETLHEPRVASSIDRYGYGWRVSGSVGQGGSDAGDTVVHHTGATPGYFAHVMVEADGRSIVVLANTYHESIAPALARLAWDLGAILDGLAPRPARGDRAIALFTWSSTGLAIGGLIAIPVSWSRRGGHHWWLKACGAGALAAALWLAPVLLGYQLRVMLIWLPDAGVSLLVGALAWTLTALILLWRRSGHPRAVGLPFRRKAAANASS